MKDWAAFVGLVLLGFLIRNVIRHAYTRIRKRIDDAIPDHLPIGGGECFRVVALLQTDLRNKGMQPGIERIDPDRLIQRFQRIRIAISLLKKSGVLFVGGQAPARPKPC